MNTSCWEFTTRKGIKRFLYYRMQFNPERFPSGKTLHVEGLQLGISSGSVCVPCDAKNGIDCAHAIEDDIKLVKSPKLCLV
jgi:hypothetical protein